MHTLLIFIDRNTLDKHAFLVNNRALNDRDHDTLWDLETRGDMAADEELMQLYYNIGFEEGLAGSEQNVSPSWVWNAWDAVTVVDAATMGEAVSRFHVFHIDLYA